MFRPAGSRRIVLATNIAETSLTVPGIRFVIDPGKARISRYSYRSKIQRLQIENISRASADQRMGRCGRERDGICIRLYDEEDYESRPTYTDPEILHASAHNTIPCVKCHTDIDPRLTRPCEPSGEVDCSNCHAKISEEYYISGHGVDHLAGEERAPVIRPLQIERRDVPARTSRSGRDTGATRTPRRPKAPEIGPNLLGS